MKIKVSDYLIEQLNRLGIEEIFGLPGDYNFSLVESVEKSENVSWIGSTNELNAGYCADGYARMKGYGALITTFGVGELSAINAIAGCMAENVPVMKIVGVPEQKHIDNRTLLHHNLINADYYAFYRAFQNVVEGSAFLTKENAKDEIDRLINLMIKTKRPVYVAIPMDVCNVEIDNDSKIKYPESDDKVLDSVVNKIIEKITNSNSPSVIAGVLTTRFGAKDELNEFLLKTQIPSCSFFRGMDIISSDVKNYFGVYFGKKDNLECSKYVNNSDCIIMSGTVISDLNTLNFDFNFNLKETINIQPDYVEIDCVKYENVLIKDVLKLLNERISYKFDRNFERTFKYEKNSLKNNPNEKLTLDYIYLKINEFLKENDILITEVGLVPFGAVKMEFPKNCTVQNQMLWGSIGWATPCALGCALADRTRRTILITGDGAHQLTAQEVSNMLRQDVKPVIFVLNNSGYTVERLLCDDVDYKYNDIAQWNYSLLPKAFRGDCYCAKVETNEDFDNTLDNINSINGEKMCYIELCTHYLDIPKLSRAVAKHPEAFEKTLV